MSDRKPKKRHVYELAAWSITGPIEPIPFLTYHRCDQPGPKPAVIYYHGVSQRKETSVDSQPAARRLADAGYLVALPDAPGHGDRPAGTTLAARLQQSLAHEFCADIEQAGDEAPTLLDWLVQRPDVNADRVAVAGVSMGGYTAAVVASRLPDRLRAACCIAGAADLPQCMAATDSIGPGKYGPPDRSIDTETADRIERIEPLRHVGRFAPLPLLLIHGRRDTWNPCETTECFAETLRPAYEATPEALRVQIIPDAPHWPPHAAMVDELITWLRDHV